MPLVKGFDIDSFLDEPIEARPVEQAEFDIDLFLDEPISKPEEIEPTWGEAIAGHAKAGALRIPAQVGGIRRAVGEKAFAELASYPEIRKELTKEVKLTPEELVSLPREEGQFLPSATVQKQALAEKRRQRIEEIKSQVPQIKAGTEMFEEYQRRAAEARPEGVDPDSIKRYVGEATEAFIGSVLPTLAVAMITKNPNIALPIMGTQVYGEKYGQARNEGRTEEQANMDALFYAASEAIPERMPLGIALKEGGRAITKIAKTIGAEGAQEMFTEILQLGYDAGVVGEETDLKTAFRQVVDAGIIGGLVGGGMSAPVIVAEKIVARKDPAEIAGEIQQEETIDDVLAKADELVSESITPEIVPEPIIEAPVTEPTRGYEAELTALAETRRQAEELIGVTPIEEDKDIAEVEKDRFRALQEARVAEEPEQPTAMELAIREAQRKREVQKSIEGVEARPVERPEIPVIEPTEAAPERIITPEVQEQIKPDEGKSVYENVAELFSAPDIAPTENVVNTIREDITSAESKGKTPFYTVRRDMGKGKYQYEAYGLDGKRIGRPSIRLPKSTAKTSQIRDTFISVPNNWVAPNYRQVSLEAPKKPVKSLGEIMVNYEYDGPKKARANSPAVKTHVTELKNRINELQKVLNCVRS